MREPHIGEIFSSPAVEIVILNLFERTGLGTRLSIISLAVWFLLEPLSVSQSSHSVPPHRAHDTWSPVPHRGKAIHLRLRCTGREGHRWHALHRVTHRHRCFSGLHLGLLRIGCGRTLHPLRHMTLHWGLTRLVLIHRSVWRDTCCTPLIWGRTCSL